MTPASEGVHAMPQPVRVFVSYASQDRAFAERLVNDLKAAGAEVWWDVSGIDEGDFLGKINEALQQCQWLVLVLTPNAVASKWVTIEVNAAINRRENGLMRGVLPVLSRPMAHDAIPPVWDNLHRYDAVSNYSGEVARLILTLGLSGAPAEPPLTQPAIPAVPPVHAAPSERFPPRLAELGYHVAFLNGAEVILPPMCEVPAGPFLMGSDNRKDLLAEDNEQPQHQVTLAVFQIAKYPVTVAEYACFMRATNRSEPKNLFYPLTWAEQFAKQLEHPVVNVGWQDAGAYTQWLTERTERTWRLPTEAEWEKAARGTDARIYAWGNRWDPAKAEMDTGNNSRTTPVGSYPEGASSYGAEEMGGNWSEWTNSLFRPYPYNATDGRENAKSADKRVIRGGSYPTRAASRFGHSQAPFDFSASGFRLACTDTCS
jgi:formylglycine-generating enzyme required for sulfatase activity